MLQYDQLLAQRAAAAAFEGFEEAPITFMPTFKVLAGMGGKRSDVHTHEKVHKMVCAGVDSGQRDRERVGER